MQYRFVKMSFEGNRFDAAKAKLLRSRAGNAFHIQPSTVLENYAGRFLDFSGKIRFFAGGRQIPITGIPLYSWLADNLSVTTEAYAQPLPGDLIPAPAHAHATSGTSDAGRSETFHQDITDERGWQPATQHISSAVLGSLLSVTVAMATGIIIASNTSFKLKVSPDTQAADVLADAATLPSEALPAQAAQVAQEARAIQAPAAPLISVPGSASHQVERPHKRHIRTMAVRKSPHLKSRAAGATTVVSRAPGAQVTRKMRQTGLASLASRKHPRPASATQVATAPILHDRPSLQDLSGKYARCAQLEGLLRRERCKWEVCGGRWGKQGCPSYKYKTAAEMGMGQLYPDETVPPVEDG